MIARIGLTLLIALALFIAGGLALPRVVEVARHVEIERPPATVHGLVDGFATFPLWSPWTRRDPDMSFTVSEPPTGSGAWFEWRGDPRQVGSGRQQVVGSAPYRSVTILVEHEQLGRSTVTFEIERIAGGARLVWRHENDLVQGRGWVGGVLSRYFGLFYRHWIDREIRQGLLRIEALAESLPAADFSGLRVERVEAHARDIVSRTAFDGRGGQSAARDLADAWRELALFVDAQGLERNGQPLAITRSGADGWRVEAALPVVAADALPAPPIRLERSPAGPAVRVVHRGPYEDVAGVYVKLAAWMAVHGLGDAGVSWEEYLSDPAVTPPEERETRIYVLLDE